jgi:hypothetical protein
MELKPAHKEAGILIDALEALEKMMMLLLAYLMVLLPGYLTRRMTLKQCKNLKKKNKKDRKN